MNQVKEKCAKRLDGWKRLHSLYRFRRSRNILDAAADWLDKEIYDLENWLLGREVRKSIKEVSTTTQLNLDGQELIMISTALAEKANDLISRGNPYEGEHHLLLSIKVRNARVDFHAKHYAVLREKYGLKEEEPACRQTLLG